MKQYVAYIIIISGLTVSCGYYPRLTGIPLMREKGDTRIEGGIALIHPANISVTYGLTDHIAVQAAASFNLHRDEVFSERDYYAHGTIGYFKNMQDRKILEWYGGFGYGYSRSYNDANPGWLYGNYRVYYTQVNFGSIEKKKANMEYGIGLKSGYQHSKMTDEYYFFRSDEQTPQKKPFPVYSLNGILIEPTVFLRLGGPKLKFNASFGVCKWFQLTHTDKKLPGWPFNLGSGFSYSF